MPNRLRTLLLVLAAQSALIETAVAQPPRRPALPQRMELDTADIQMFPEPPSDITQHQPQIPHGKLEIIEYLSKTVGTTRRMNVYTPPLYSTEKNIPSSICCMGSAVMKPNGNDLLTPQTCSII
ncbi:MAG: hypothetical protein ACKPHU_22850 [Planctomycetaceae bacterium]